MIKADIEKLMHLKMLHEENITVLGIITDSDPWVVHVILNTDNGLLDLKIDGPQKEFEITEIKSMEHFDKLCAEECYKLNRPLEVKETENGTFDTSVFYFENGHVFNLGSVAVFKVHDDVLQEMEENICGIKGFKSYIEEQKQKDTFSKNVNLDDILNKTNNDLNDSKTHSFMQKADKLTKDEIKPDER